VSETENESQVDETTEAPEEQVAEAPEEPVAEPPEPAAEEPGPTEEEAVESPDETEPPAAEGEAPAEAEGTVPSGDSPRRQRSRKHVPRSERRQRPKRVRANTGARKPIVRLPKPEGERGRRQERRGVVVSNAMEKTIVVKVDVIKLHPRYKKVIRRSQKFHAHDERNEANVGDLVRIVETRPLSKTKTWRLAEVVEAAK
jgi:small subunit ribosomal protein S17